MFIFIKMALNWCDKLRNIFLHECVKIFLLHECVKTKKMQDCVVYPLGTSYIIMSLNIHYKSTKRGNRERSEFQKKPNAIGNASNISPVQKNNTIFNKNSATKAWHSSHTKNTRPKSKQ